MQCLAFNGCNRGVRARSILIDFFEWYYHFSIPEGLSFFLSCMYKWLAFMPVKIAQQTSTFRPCAALTTHSNFTISAKSPLFSQTPWKTQKQRGGIMKNIWVYIPGLALKWRNTWSNIGKMTGWCLSIWFKLKQKSILVSKVRAVIANKCVLKSLHKVLLRAFHSSYASDGHRWHWLDVLFSTMKSVRETLIRDTRLFLMIRRKWMEQQSRGLKTEDDTQ